MVPRPLAPTHAMGSSKYGTTRKNSQRYYTTKRVIRYIYFAHRRPVIVFNLCSLCFWRVIVKCSCTIFHHAQELLTVNKFIYYQLPNYKYINITVIL